MEGEPAFPGPFGRRFACIYFDTAKISCLLRDKVTPQKATWTAANALPADSGHVITQHSLANSGTHPQHTVYLSHATQTWLTSNTLPYMKLGLIVKTGKMAEKFKVCAISIS